MIKPITKNSGVVVVCLFVCLLLRECSHLAARRNMSSWSSANWWGFQTCNTHNNRDRQTLSPLSIPPSQFLLCTYIAIVHSVENACCFSHITLVFLTLWSCAWNHFIELQEPVLLVFVLESIGFTGEQKTPHFQCMAKCILSVNVLQYSVPYQFLVVCDPGLRTRVSLTGTEGSRGRGGGGGGGGRGWRHMTLWKLSLMRKEQNSKVKRAEFKFKRDWQHLEQILNLKGADFEFKVTAVTCWLWGMYMSSFLSVSLLQRENTVLWSSP